MQWIICENSRALLVSCTCLYVDGVCIAKASDACTVNIYFFRVDANYNIYNLTLLCSVATVAGVE